MSETTTVIHHSVLRLLETSYVDNYFNLEHVRKHKTCTGCLKRDVMNTFVKSSRCSLFQHLGRTM